MIKLLVVDHHPVVYNGLDAFFKNSRNIKIVGHVHQGKAILDFVKKRQVDIVLTEIDLEDLNGISAIKRVKKQHPEIKIIVFTNQLEHVYGSNAIKAGATGFVSKKESLKTLDKAILKVFNNAIYVSENLANQLTFSSKKNAISNDFKNLSSRELEVLKLLSEGKRNKDIAVELELSEKTVSTYRSRLMKKLNVSNLVELIKMSERERIY